jgi:glycosyltransferase involved in cell wall biosynthesis
VPRAIYIGDVRRSRGLPVMLAAVEAAPGWELDVVGPVAAADQAWLDHWVATSPAASRVRFHGRKPPLQAWALARGAWVGLSLLDDTPAFRDAVPTKLYEYLAAGLAVATTPLPRAAAIVTESAAGVVVPDADVLSATLRGWAEQPASLLPLRSSAGTWAATAFAGASGYDVLARRLSALAGATTQSSTVEVE